MTELTALPETEEDVFAAGLKDGGLAGAGFSDDLLARCRDAITQAASGGPATATGCRSAGPPGSATRSELDGVPYRLLAGSLPGVPANPEIWRKCGVSPLPGPDGCLLLEAKPYQPAWLDAHSPVDAASAADIPGVLCHSASGSFLRRRDYVPGYYTPGQRSAARAAVSMPDGGTLIAELPTGSGKTEIAISLADISHRADRRHRGSHSRAGLRFRAPLPGPARPAIRPRSPAPGVRLDRRNRPGDPRIDARQT